MAVSASAGVVHVVWDKRYLTRVDGNGSKVWTVDMLLGAEDKAMRVHSIPGGGVVVAGTAHADLHGRSKILHHVPCPLIPHP